MNKTYCVKCGKEIEYEGFFCPVRCLECDNKQSEVSSEFNIRAYIDSMIKVSVPCLICGEMIKECERFEVKVCDKCKQAVITMREQIEEHERTGGVCLD